MRICLAPSQAPESVLQLGYGVRTFSSYQYMIIISNMYL
ncbi:hypothetical protein EDF78_11940 [Rahnella sp. BIGb0236]|nr:hypothetical protein EDF78_11940 [Rahnella sp. BIGb0236]